MIILRTLLTSFGKGLEKFPCQNSSISAFYLNVLFRYNMYMFFHGFNTQTARRSSSISKYELVKLNNIYKPRDLKFIMHFTYVLCLSKTKYMDLHTCTLIFRKRLSMKKKIMIIWCRQTFSIFFCRHSSSVKGEHGTQEETKEGEWGRDWRRWNGWLSYMECVNLCCKTWNIFHYCIHWCIEM